MEEVHSRVNKALEILRAMQTCECDQIDSYIHAVDSNGEDVQRRILQHDILKREKKCLGHKAYAKARTAQLQNKILILRFKNTVWNNVVLPQNKVQPVSYMISNWKHDEWHSQKGKEKLDRETLSAGSKNAFPFRGKILL